MDRGAPPAGRRTAGRRDRLGRAFDRAAQLNAALVWCPFPGEDEAAAVAGRLLDERLIVCANLVPAIRSLYEWNGERGDTRECGALFKTEATLLARAIARIEELHSYDAPAIVGWNADRCGDATAEWLETLIGPAR